MTWSSTKIRNDAQNAVQYYRLLLYSVLYLSFSTLASFGGTPQPPQILLPRFVPIIIYQSTVLYCMLLPNPTF